MSAENNPPNLTILPCNGRDYTQLSVRYDLEQKASWGYMHATPRPSFTPTLLSELGCWLDRLAEEIDTEAGREIEYVILASRIPGIFNLGGDLNLFSTLIGNKDVQGLYEYGERCVKLANRFYSNLERDLTTIALVQGDALGGGFECALAANVLVAERNARLGFPEVMFNLFPGMGAYSFLSRRLDASRAKQMILSGRIYTVEELYEMGLVDVLAEDGQGEAAVRDYIKRENRARNGYRALRTVMKQVDPVSYDELLQVVEIWAEAALELQPRDLHMMERLVMRQSAKHGKAA